MRAEPKNTMVSRIFSSAEMRQRLQDIRERMRSARASGLLEEIFVQVGDRAAVAVVGVSVASFGLILLRAATRFFNSRTVFSNLRQILETR